jgi:hypothetical protein
LIAVLGEVIDNILSPNCSRDMWSEYVVFIVNGSSFCLSSVQGLTGQGSAAHLGSFGQLLSSGSGQLSSLGQMSGQASSGLGGYGQPLQTQTSGHIGSLQGHLGQPRYTIPPSGSMLQQDSFSLPDASKLLWLNYLTVWESVGCSDRGHRHTLPCTCWLCVPQETEPGTLSSVSQLPQLWICLSPFLFA